MCKNFFQKKVISSFKPDISKLKEQNILNEHKHKLSNNIGPIGQTLNYDFNWKTVKEIILNTIKKKNIRNLRCHNRNKRFDDECRKSTEEKNKAYLLMLQKHRRRIPEVKYKDLRKVEKKVHRRKKMAFLEDSLK